MRSKEFFPIRVINVTKGINTNITLNTQKQYLLMAYYLLVNMETFEYSFTA